MKRLLIPVFAVLFTVSGFLFQSEAVLAQTSQKLQVSPTRHSIEVDPGEVITFEFKFYNFSEKPVAGIIKSGDFIVTDSLGIPRILDNPDEVLPRFSGASWVTLPFDRIAIAPGDKAPVRVSIQVPKDARPGGRYVAIYFEPAAGTLSLGGLKEEAGASVAQRIAGLIYLRVKGPITEKAYISRLFGPSFLEYGPIHIETDILNRGDYHIRPRGSVSLRNMFRAVTDQKKIEEVNIFPDTSRSYKFSLGEKWLLGRYNIGITAAYGDAGQIIQRSIDIWVFPWKIALALFLGLVILILIFKSVIKNVFKKQGQLEEDLKKEHEEVEKLRQELDEHN